MRDPRMTRRPAHPVIELTMLKRTPAIAPAGLFKEGQRSQVCFSLTTLV